MIDQLGSPDTYNHYPTGWAVAFSTPFRMFKRYSYQGGVCDPLVIHWPEGIKAKGEVRHQYHHCTDIVPTILDCCGVEMPDGRRRRTSRHRCPVCRCATRSTPPTPRPPRRRSTTRCSVPAASGTTAGRPSPSTVLYRSDSATSTKTAGSCSTPTKIAPRPTTSPNSTQKRSKSSRQLWLEEAEKYNVLPLNDLGILEYRAFESSSRDRRSRRAGSTRTTRGRPKCPERRRPTRSTSPTRSSPRSSSPADSQGVIFAQGSRFGGYSMFVKDGKLTYVYNFLGIPPEQTLTADAPAPGRHIVGVEFTKERRRRKPRADRTAQAVHRRRRRRRDGDPHVASRLQPVR